MSWATDLDDEFGVSTSGPSRLKSLFASTAHTHERECLAAPRQPSQPVAGKGVTQASPQATNETVLFAAVVDTFLQDDNQFRPQGKQGLALLGDNVASLYRLLLYDGSRQTRCQATVTQNFSLWAQGSLYVYFDDKDNRKWSIHFDSVSSLSLFAATVVQMKCAGAGADTVCAVNYQPGDGEEISTVEDTVDAQCKVWPIDDIRAPKPPDTSGTQQQQGMNISCKEGWGARLVGMKCGGSRMLVFPPTLSEGLPFVQKGFLLVDVQVTGIQRPEAGAKEKSAENETSAHVVKESPAIPVSPPQSESGGGGKRQTLKERMARIGARPLLFAGAVAATPSSEDEGPESPPLPAPQFHPAPPCLDHNPASTESSGPPQPQPKPRNRPAIVKSRPNKGLPSPSPITPTTLKPAPVPSPRPPPAHLASGNAGMYSSNTSKSDQKFAQESAIGARKVASVPLPGRSVSQNAIPYGGHDESAAQMLLQALADRNAAQNELHTVSQQVQSLTQLVSALEGAMDRLGLLIKSQNPIPILQATKHGSAPSIDPRAVAVTLERVIGDCGSAQKGVEDTGKRVDGLNEEVARLLEANSQALAKLSFITKEAQEAEADTAHRKRSADANRQKHQQLAHDAAGLEKRKAELMQKINGAEKRSQESKLHLEKLQTAAETRKKKNKDTFLNTTSNDSDVDQQKRLADARSKGLAKALNEETRPDPTRLKNAVDQIYSILVDTIDSNGTYSGSQVLEATVQALRGGTAAALR